MDYQPIIWSPGITLEALEKMVILKAFQFYRANKTATANSLGISIRTLDSKLEKYAAQGQAEKERQENERNKQSDFLARCRGPARDSTGSAIASPVTVTAQTIGNSPSATSGVRVESAEDFISKPAVPLHERKEVQDVLPKHAAAGGKGGRR